MEYPNTYVVYDLETTGVDPSEDEAIEIGALKVEDGKIVASKSWILKPSVPIPAAASAIHGITQEFVEKNGRDRYECWEEFVDFIGLNAMVPAWPIVGHNIVRFDNLFVARAIRFIGFELGGFEFIDTAGIYKGQKLNLTREENESHHDYALRVLEVNAYGLKYKLTGVYEELGGSMQGIEAHRAEADVLMTNYVYRKLAKLDWEYVDTGMPPVAVGPNAVS